MQSKDEQYKLMGESVNIFSFLSNKRVSLLFKCSASEQNYSLKWRRQVRFPFSNTQNFCSVKFKTFSFINRILVQYQTLNSENNSLIFQVLFLFFSIDHGELKLVIVFAIHLPTLFWVSRASFSSFLRKIGTIWCWLSTGLVFTSV